jgi:hypothetical protein
MRCVVAEVEVDEVAAAEQGGCKYGVVSVLMMRSV